MKIGYLPLYIKLYDDIGVQRDAVQNFYEETTEMFKNNGLEVVTVDFCRVKPEFEAAVALFEAEKVDAIVTWHAAYSPSLESIEALANTKLPIIVFDSTPTLTFDMQQDPVEIDANHGIHGVMDMCSMLKRHEKAYAIAAGHYKESDVIKRVCGLVRGAVAATALSKMKVALFGGSFHGMGDFAVSAKEMKKRFGVEILNIAPKEIASYVKTITDEEIAEEIQKDKERFDFCDDVISEEYVDFTRSCLALRKYVADNQFTAFSVNFLNVEGLGTMPFLEACKSLEQGIGYAGEGDALTASFTGALLSAYPESSFVEIFCPDWQNNMLFLSHMGEMNYRIADGKPYVCRTGSAFVKGTMPYVGYAKMKAGKGVYVNISREKDGYQMLLTPAEILEAGEDNFPRTIRGWMRPTSESTASFLEALSRNGATHHSTFVYGATIEELEFFGQLLSLKTVIV